MITALAPGPILTFKYEPRSNRHIGPIQNAWRWHGGGVKVAWKPGNANASHRLCRDYEIYSFRSCRLPSQIGPIRTRRRSGCRRRGRGDGADVGVAPGLQAGTDHALGVDHAQLSRPYEGAGLASSRSRCSARCSLPSFTAFVAGAATVHIGAAAGQARAAHKKAARPGSRAPGSTRRENQADTRDI